VPIHHLMEDAATAEISRAQLWQWLHYGGPVALRLEDGTPIDFTLFDTALASVAERVPAHPRLQEAADLLARMTHAEELEEFLTLPAYERLA
jgi:malate synthase